MQFTEQQILAAARVLSDRSAKECNVNKDDNWDIYCGNYIDDAKAALAVLSAAAPQVVADELQTALTVFDMGLGFALCHRDFGDMRNAVKKLQIDFAEIRAAIAADPVQAYRNDPAVHGMADCMDLVRQELIEAGVIGADVAPMFIANAVVAKLAAPVQAQEPVAAKPVGRVWKCREDHFLYAKLDGGIAASGAVKLGDILYTAAPVQPVAVPDGWKMVPRELSDDHLREVMDNINRKYKGNPLGEDFTRLVWQWAIHASPAAPAAQGDAKDDINAELVAALKDITDDVCERFDIGSSSTNPGIKNCVERARAAIAAMAAS